MAYLDIDNMFAAPVRSRAMASAAATESGETGFSALEWSVIAVSRRDSLSSLEEPGRVSRALGSLFGFGTKSRLADSKLEALRRLAVHAWRRGYAVAQAEIDRFLDAGFTLSQAETLVASVTGDRVGLVQIYANPRIAA
ncbi:MAG: hypothetical protein V4610_07250 [Pseudomonadota bacterium]|jgi:hypothetical protein|uniref:Uncharacterized protein n=1 Tax=hydrothermal vent metagenome TaxID=652676 RepID=A0A160TI76_9ZZZZ